MKLFPLILLLIVWQTCPIVARECTGPNESYLDCGPPCDQECSRLNEPCMIAYFRCPDGCYCNDGYARDHSSNCIPKQQCPSKN